MRGLYHLWVGQWSVYHRLLPPVPVVAIRWSNGLADVDPLLELLPASKEGKFFRLNMNRSSGFGISAGVCLVIFNKNASKTADFNPLAGRQGVCHGVEEDIHDFLCLVAGKTVLVF